MFKRITLLLLLIFNYSFLILYAQAPRSYTSSEILLQLKKLNTVGAVLYIAAHPDDENTRLISYLANEKCVRTGYLSLTRGDGGQNLIGPEQGIELGVIRTQELLAARRIDGGEQFFTRAYDFGFSKSPEETFQKWNRDSILGDMVWVIRNFRPDIIITRFAPDGSGGHGHHTASAILAEEAFDAAADPNRFPEQLKYVSVWKTRRMFHNSTARFFNPNADLSHLIKLDVGGYNPLLGKSYGEIAAESRSMHKSQGFGSAKQRGESFEYFKPVKGDTAGLKDIFEGIDFTWKRVKGGEKYGSFITKIINTYKVEKPEESLQSLIELRDKLNKEPENYILNYKLNYLDAHRMDLTVAIQERNKLFYVELGKIAQLDEIIASSGGIVFDATADGFNTAQGSTTNITLSINARRPTDANLTHIQYRLDADSNCSIPFVTNKEYKFTKSVNLKSDYLHSVHYWLQQPIHEGMFTVPLVNIGLPQNNWNEDKASFSLFVKGRTLKISKTIQYKWVEPDKGELYRPVVITPPVMINVENSLLTFSNNEVKDFKITLKAGKDSIKGEFEILIPKNWEISCVGDGVYEPFISTKRSAGEGMYTSCEFNLNKKGDSKTYQLQIKPTNLSVDTVIKVNVIIDGIRYSQGIKEIKYDHIPVQTLFPEAEVKLVKLDVVKKSKRIGYIPGAGDEVQTCLTQLGYEVVTLTDEKLANENLKQYDAIITGVRAYNTNEKLPSFKQKLMDYVAAGGNLIVQYNTNSWAGPLNSDIGPYRFKISRNRITDENAEVRMLIPNHPVFNSPNKITNKDFEGWIQERSIYHANEWDSTHYEAPISMTDPYEMTVGSVSPKGKPDNGALLITKHGKGNFIYTGLVFFRELPAGVPGAYRLLVNMIELGK